MAGLCLALLCAVPALAQNAAEGDAKPPPANTADAASPTPDAGQDSTAGNTAEGPAATPGKDQPPAKPKPKPAPPAKAKPDKTKPDAGQAGPAAPGQSPPPAAPAPNAGEAQPKGPAATPPAGAPDKGGSAAAPNAAEGSAGASSPNVGPQPPGASPAPKPGAATPPAAAPNQGPPPAPGPAANAPNANAAEARVQSGTANSAESGAKPAEPPVPPYQLPLPGEVAGPTTGYTAPEINLNVPGIETLPEPAPNDAFQQPTRDYLNNRPLPPPNQTETDEERVAESIEESLKTLDLAKEQRNNEVIKLPLPSGQVSFKAADSFTYDRKNRVLTFTGSSQLYFGNMLVAADYIQVDDGAATAYAKGYVMIQQNDEVIYADEAYLNYDTEHLELFNVEGNTGGSRLTNGVVYFTADHLYGTWNNMTMEHCTLTTCDPFCGDTREVHLSAHKVVYKRDRSIVLHDVYVHVRSHKVAWTPLLAFPLVKQKQRFSEQQTKIQQDYGYDTQNGWFAKFAYTYYTHYVEKAQANLLGVARADFVQNFGPDIGIRQDFYIPALGVTTIRGDYQRDWPFVFAHDVLGRKQINATKNFEFHLKQELNLSRALRGNLSSDRVNRFVPSATTNGAGTRNDTWNSNFNLAYTHSNTSATLSGSQQIITQGGTTDQGGTQQPRSQTINSSGSFSYNQTMARNLKFKLDDQYTANKGSGTTSGIPADQEGTFDMSLDYTYLDNPARPGGASAPAPATPKNTAEGAAAGEAAPKPKSTPFDGLHAALEYKEQGIDYDQDRNTRDNNNQVDKELPDLKIDLPRDLINDHAYFNSFGIDLGNLVTGRRRAPQSSFRAALTAGGSGSMLFSRGARLSSNTRLEQFWYDDGNAQYNVNENLSYNYDNYRGFQFSSNWAVNFHQGVREPPVTSDRRVYSQTLNYGTTLTNYRSWRWQLQSGFNLATDRHNPLTSTFNWAPNKTFSFIHSASYNIENTSWDFSSFQGSWRSPYVDPSGVYNWVFNTSINADTNYWDNWAMTQLLMSYFRRYERGWSIEVTGGSRVGSKGDRPPDFREDFLRSMVKTVTVRKVNCCTTLEGSWNAQNHSFDVKLYLNALPQYPGTLDDSRSQSYNQDTGGLGNYVYKPHFLFPTDSLRTDILQDMFGISGTTF